MNVEGVAFHATALQQVANDLQKSINQAREPTVGSELGFAKWVTGYVSSTLILRALATEQMLKVLSYMRTGNYRTDGKGCESFVAKATYIVLFEPFMRRAEFSRNYRWRFDTALWRWISISP